MNVIFESLHATQFLVRIYPRVFSGHFNKPNSISTPAGNRLGSVNWPEDTVGIKKCVEWGSQCEKYEHKVSYGLALRNAELSTSDPETPGN